jgi:hypothetical protein
MRAKIELGEAVRLPLGSAAEAGASVDPAGIDRVERVMTDHVLAYRRCAAWLTRRRGGSGRDGCAACARCTVLLVDPAAIALGLLTGSGVVSETLEAARRKLRSRMSREAKDVVRGSGDGDQFDSSDRDSSR